MPRPRLAHSARWYALYGARGVVENRRGRERAGDVSATGSGWLPMAGSGCGANLLAGVCTTPLPTWRELMLAYSTYRDAFHRDAAALATAARRGLAAPVPSCPGWTVATLVTHLVWIFVHRIKDVRV